MYNDCCDITMYPLQMVLPLISQHVGASQSSTIGNNGSSRGHPPHYHLNHNSPHQNGHPPASSRLTTLSQHLPVEILNCIQPTLNQLANSLASASNDSKVINTSGGGGGGNTSAASCNGKQCSSTSSSSPTPSSIPPAMSNFPPLVKTQRAGKSSGGTPRKTWQNCATADLSPSLVNSAEYPQLNQKCKVQAESVQSQQGTTPASDVCQKANLAEKSCAAHPIQHAKLKKTEITALSSNFESSAGGKCAKPFENVQENSVKIPYGCSQSKYAGVSESVTKTSGEKVASESRTDGQRCMAPNCVLRNNGAVQTGNQHHLQPHKYDQGNNVKENSSRTNEMSVSAAGNSTGGSEVSQGGNAGRSLGSSDNHLPNNGSAAKCSEQANQNRSGKCKLGTCCDRKCICCIGQNYLMQERSEMSAEGKFTFIMPCSPFGAKGNLNIISGGKIVRKKTGVTPSRDKSVAALSPVTPVPPCDTTNSTVIKQDSKPCTNHVKKTPIPVNSVQSDDGSSVRSSETRRSSSKTSCIDVNSVQEALHLVEDTMARPPSRVSSEIPSLPCVNISSQSDDNCDTKLRETYSLSQDNSSRSTAPVQSNCANQTGSDPAKPQTQCSEQRVGHTNGNKKQSDMNGDRNKMNHVRSDVREDRNEVIENRGDMNGNRSDVNGHRANIDENQSDINASQGDINGQKSDTNVNRSNGDGCRYDGNGHVSLNGNSNELYPQGKHDRDSPGSNSSPSDSSGHSNKENYANKYNKNNGDYQHHYYHNGHYHSNGYHGYNGRNHGSLQSSRTNSYDDLKANERYYDNRDFRHSSSKLSDSGGGGGGWKSHRNTFSSSTSPVRYASGGGYQGRGYQGRENRGSATHERGGSQGGNQQRRLRFVENKNYNGGNNNNNYNNTRHWVNNNRDGHNYSRGHYYNNNNNHHYNNSRSYRHNNSGYNKNNQQYSSTSSDHYGSLEDFPSNRPDPDSGGKPSTPAGSAPEGDSPLDLDRDTALTPSDGVRGSSSSLSSCSNHSGPEGKSLKRHYNTTPGPPVRSHKSLDPLPSLRPNRPLSPFESHHLNYVQNKRRNTSGPTGGGGGGGGQPQYAKPAFPPGTWLNPPLLNSPLGRHFSQRRPLGPDINFYTPALASLAIQQGAGGAPLLPLGPPPLVTSYASTMLTELPWHVPELEAWDPLSKSIWSRFLEAQQTDTRFRQKLTLTRAVEEYVRFTLREPQFRLFLVGSTMSGFGTDASDVDMCLGIRPYEFDRGLAIRVLYVLENNMHYFELFKKAELIHAKVPILKFQDSSFKLEVDLNCNNVVGVRNTHLLYCYAQMDWRIRPLVLLVKLWARAHNINDAKNMTISSYSFTLMVIHFLQCGPSPPVLPNLVAQYPGKFSAGASIEAIQIHETLAPFRSSNEESLGALLTQFFHYYAHFEYFEYAISVRRGTKIPIEECRNHKSQRNKYNQWKYLCIEEPFDLTNTARSVYNLEVFEHIRGVIRKCSSLLEETQDLNSIFQPQPQPHSS